MMIIMMMFMIIIMIITITQHYTTNNVAMIMMIGNKWYPIGYDVLDLVIQCAFQYVSVTQLKHKQSW